MAKTPLSRIFNTVTCLIGNDWLPNDWKKQTQETVMEGQNIIDELGIKDYERGNQLGNIQMDPYESLFNDPYAEPTLRSVVINLLISCASRCCVYKVCQYKGMSDDVCSFLKGRCAC